MPGYLQVRIKFRIFVLNLKNICLMNKKIIVEEKDGRVRVEMSVREWRFYEKARQNYELARRIARANRQAEKAKVMSLEEAEDFIKSL